MKKAGLALVVLLALVFAVSIAVPVLARPVKANQIIVTVKHSDGKPVAKTAVIVGQDNAANARTTVKTTKGNGVVVFTLSRDTYTIGWDMTNPLEVAVYNNIDLHYDSFSPYYFYGDLSASIEITVDW